MESTAISSNIIPFSQPAGITARSTGGVKKQESSENGLQNAAKVLSFIWDNSNEGMRLTDEKGTIISVNSSYCRLVGMMFEELIGKHFTCVYAEMENREKMTRAYESRFKERAAEPQHEKRFVLWTNQILDVEVCDSYVESDDGHMLMLSQFRDITAEKITHTALTESESKYRGLFANSVMPMFQSSPEGKLINANRAMLKLLGYSNFYELAELDIARDTYADPEERKALTETLHQKGYVVNTEISLKRKNGRVITVLENARTVVDEDGKVISYEGVLEDITARKAMEKKLQEYVWALEKSKNALSDLNAQKDKLFSILSHDLRSPFSSILGFCDILLKENDQLTAEDRLQFVAYIQEAAQDQLSLVNKLLDWSRLESGRIRMEHVELDLHDIVRKNLNSLMGLALQKQVKLQTNLPPKVMVYGDKHMLGQVFGNLLGNSLKFTPPNGTVTVELIEEQSNHWVIGVRDTGIGIPEDDVHKLFKIEEKYTRKGLQGEKGTGLGLPIVHEIIQKHHGSISVKSVSGTGTLFLITLPKSKPEAGENILVVDDEHGVRLLHTRYIKRVLPNANVLHAADGTEAFQLAREFNPQAIISDNDMPDLDGLELVRNLKADPATSDIPIIIVTGQDSDSNREALKQFGVTAILNKPVTPEQIAKVLRSIDLGQTTVAA
ncbi:MAG: PAS domain S-box protein [Bacteroidota bacterium]